MPPRYVTRSYLMNRLAYVHPQPTQDMHDQFYSTYGRKSRSLTALIHEKRAQQSYIPLFEPFISKESNILDVGCGKGIFLHFLKERGYTNLHGLELSHDEIAFAKKHFDLTVSYGRPEEYLQRDFEHP